MIRLCRFKLSSGTRQPIDFVNKRRMFRLCRFSVKVRIGFSPTGKTAPCEGSSFFTPLKRNKRNKRNNQAKSKTWIVPDVVRLFLFKQTSVTDDRPVIGSAPFSQPHAPGKPS